MYSMRPACAWYLTDTILASSAPRCMNYLELSVISCTPKSGLGFFNVNVLNITNVIIKSCGAAILPLTDRIGATTGPYLPNTSYASLAIVDSSAVSLSRVSITSYYGYALLAVNVYGVSLLSDLMITGSTDLIFAGVGSGVMVYYHNSSNQASLNISKSMFTYNQLLSSASCLPESLSHSTPIPTPHCQKCNTFFGHHLYSSQMLKQYVTNIITNTIRTLPSKVG